ncbi:MAG: aminoacetone oxidase family FAD-binding enzyme [Bacteroidales bacterium]|nr:aminoacetone oxidase family FAD-binding enzyme [Bacteroidales bacterium]
MKSDIIIIGGGAAGLMAAYGAASALVSAGSDASVTLLEKMPRPGRKIMITGKGRCNFTNVKDWNEFSQHIRSNANFLKPAFFNLTPARLVEWFEAAGMPAVVERGDRAYPASYHSTDVIDTLVRACHGVGVKIQSDAEVCDVTIPTGNAPFFITTADGTAWTCRRLIIATGGLSYPGTGSTGDGYRFASASGHTITPLFPSLTALVPSGYKLLLQQHSAIPQEHSVILQERNLQTAGNQVLSKTSLVQNNQRRSSNSLALNDIQKTLAEVALSATTYPPATADMPRHIDRSTPLSELGEKLKGIQLKNVGVQLLIEGTEAGNEFGDIDFTDGGIEGPIGFQLSRKAVKALINGSRVKLVLDLKAGVPLPELTSRVKELWTEIDKDPRSRGIREKEKCRILLGKLMPWELIPAFTACNPGIITLERKGRTATKVWVNLPTIAKCLKAWTFDIAGYVGYERAVVTAGGVSNDDIVAKTLESRRVPGLYFCGEVLDADCDTGGYNLHVAFSTGLLAGQSAAKSSLQQ